MTDAQFPSTLRIRRRSDFERVYRRRCTATDELLLVFGCPNGLTHARLGLSVSRKHGSAVVRNRWKRRIREAFRLNKHQIADGVDLVVIPRADREPPLGELGESLVRLARRVAKRLGCSGAGQTGS